VPDHDLPDDHLTDGEPTTDLQETLPEPVSAPMRHAKVRAFTDHTTVGQVVVDDDGAVTIGCACGMTLTNGPGWSLDEHIRLHRAEARFLALSAVAPAGIPRLVRAPGRADD